MFFTKGESETLLIEKIFMFNNCGPWLAFLWVWHCWFVIIYTLINNTEKSQYSEFLRCIYLRPHVDVLRPLVVDLTVHRHWCCRTKPISSSARLRLTRSFHFQVGRLVSGPCLSFRSSRLCWRMLGIQNCPSVARFSLRCNISLCIGVTGNKMQTCHRVLFVSACVRGWNLLDVCVCV